jgi:hypothetical protein
VGRPAPTTPERKSRNSPPIAPYLSHPEVLKLLDATKPSGSKADIEFLTIKVTLPNEARGSVGDRKPMREMDTADQTMALKRTANMRPGFYAGIKPEPNVELRGR